jgi:hypothetical protein
MKQMLCDGCGSVLEEKRGPISGVVAISGERMNGGGGGGLPDGRFDWCTSCAQVAFAAVQVARKAAP